MHIFWSQGLTKKIEPILNLTVENLIKNCGVTEFYIGNHGNFDAMARRVLEDFSSLYPITYSIVLAYLPEHKNEYDTLRNTIYPEGIETVPKRFAISRRNKWMIEQADFVVTYVTCNFGGAWQFKRLAEKSAKKVIELTAFTE